MTQPPYPGPEEAPNPFFDATQGLSTHGLKPARGLAILAAIGAAVLAAIEVIEVALASAAQETYLDAAADGVNAADVWTAYDLIAVTATIVGIAAYVVTCLWLHRLRTNLEVSHPGARHTRRKGWVWGGWLVPVVNLWFPFQIVRDISKVSSDRSPNQLLGYWWTSWLIYNFTGLIGLQLTGFGEIDPDAIQVLSNVESVNAVFAVVSVCLWLMVIRHITLRRDL